jgi:hypothetical protein
LALGGSSFEYILSMFSGIMLKQPQPPHAAGLVDSFSFHRPHKVVSRVRLAINFIPAALAIVLA